MIHPRDRHGASRAVAYLMLAGIPFIIVSILLVPEFLGTGLAAAVHVTVFILLLALGAFVCLRYSDRMPDWSWVALPVLCAGGIAWLDVATRDAGVTGQVFFLWPVLFAATFLARRMVYVVLAAVFVSEAVVVFTLLPVKKAISDGTGLMCTLTMAAVIIVFLRERRDQLLDALEAEALADPLTGLGNRRALDRDLAHAVAWSRRTAEPLALITVDVDHFKAINDTYGHATGDIALRAVGQALKEVVREYDVVARLGGDEFVVLMRSGIGGATRVADDLRARFAASAGLPGGPPTLSIGIAVLPDHAKTADELLAASDAALYEAKIAGRARTACAHPRQEPFTARRPATAPPT